MLRSTIFFILTIFISTKAFSVNSFLEPNQTFLSWWERGSTGSLYAGWDQFGPSANDLSGGYFQEQGAPWTYINSDQSPDGYYLQTVNGLIQVSPTPFGVEDIISNGSIIVPAAQIVAGSGLGIFVTSTNNLYSFSAPPSYDIILVANNDHQSLDGPITVSLQIATLGNDIDDSTVKLIGVDLDGSPNTANDIVDLPFDNKYTIFSDSIDAHAGPSTYREYLYVWELDSVQSAYDIRVSAQGSSMSLDALAVDIGPHEEANVPFLPAWGIYFLGIGLFLAAKNSKIHRI